LLLGADEAALAADGPPTPVALAQYVTPRAPPTMWRAREKTALIHPASGFMRRWDMVTLVLLAFTAVVTPFEVCFLDPSSDITDGLFWVDRLVDLLFAVDVFVNFNLSYLDPSTTRMVTGRATVAWRYARGSAVLDIVSTIPFDVIGQEAGAQGASNLKVLRILRIFRLFKLLRVLRSSRVLQRMQDSMNINYGYVTLAKFACSCLLIAHWMACLLHLVHASQQGSCNWVNRYYGNLAGYTGHSACEFNGEDVSVESRYLTSLYWVRALHTQARASHPTHLTSCYPCFASAERDDHQHGRLWRRCAADGRGAGVRDPGHAAGREHVRIRRRLRVRRGGDAEREGDGA
jgi:hypothetical protein